MVRATVHLSREPGATAASRVRDHVPVMSADKPDTGDGNGLGKGGDVMSSLPRTRPQRPSRRRASGRTGDAKSKRAPRAAAAPSGASRAASGRPKPAGVRPSAATRAARNAPPPQRPPSPPSGTDLVGTAVQAAGEIAQLGLTLGTRALRDAVKRIPRP
jgi:hypothetical protein